ncbi:hypothetical protein BY458DRAFT_493678 [Sporodiniella umbellata]|nr:hypothetical protein BY458DRAFT_493678 [Sporodiniella umbellata]
MTVVRVQASVARRKDLDCQSLHEFALAKSFFPLVFYRKNLKQAYLNIGHQISPGAFCTSKKMNGPPTVLIDDRKYSIKSSLFSKRIYNQTGQYRDNEKITTEKVFLASIAVKTILGIVIRRVFSVGDRKDETMLGALVLFC